tara:strand:- start:2421 stop:2927 length:507 start_codon:yes stop_codon:yes gene_type:complete
MPNRLVIGRGNVFADLLVVGEAPGLEEDKVGKPFIGRSGKLLSDLFIKSGINEDRDVYFCNVLKCRPPNNRKPSKKEMIIHTPWVIQQIKVVNPRIVLLTGTTAMIAILNVKEPISKVRGKWIKKGGIYYFTIFHPSYLMRFSRDESKNAYGLTLKDLLNVKSKLYNL